MAQSENTDLSVTFEHVLKGICTSPKLCAAWLCGARVTFFK